MKFSILLILAPILAFAQSEYEQQLSDERRSKEELLLHSRQVLNEDEQSRIEALQYYPIQVDWIISAEFQKDRGKTFEMPTTTERKPLYRREGYLIFIVEDSTYQLTVYKNLDLKGKPYKNYYFLPFKDATAPNETYGGGRYVEINQKLRNRQPIPIDFNTAFNPYCVYSYRFSCPITPKENELPLRVEAGERLPIMDETKSP
jgi:uncharacterized protein